MCVRGCGSPRIPNHVYVYTNTGLSCASYIVSCVRVCIYTIAGYWCMCVCVRAVYTSAQPTNQGEFATDACMNGLRVTRHHGPIARFMHSHLECVCAHNTTLEGLGGYYVRACIIPLVISNACVCAYAQQGGVCAYAGVKVY